MESVSIVTNGSKVTEPFLRKYGKFIDVLAVSCDSFNEATNIVIGRGDGGNRLDRRHVRPPRGGEMGVALRALDRLAQQLRRQPQSMVTRRTVDQLVWHD